MPKDLAEDTVWTKLATVDRKYVKPITGKSYKGDSPNPTYIIMKLTEVFGPIGDQWGFNVKFDNVREGKPHQIIASQRQRMSEPDQNGKQHTLEKEVTYQILREEMHELCITFWFERLDGQVKTFDAYGGTPMLYMTKAGNWMHDEDAAKKSLTDAYTKGASWLGACADIFLGLFDDKYTSQPHGGDSPQPLQGGGQQGGQRNTQQNGQSRQDRHPDDDWGNDDQQGSSQGQNQQGNGQSGGQSGGQRNTSAPANDDDWD